MIDHSLRWREATKRFGECDRSPYRSPGRCSLRCYHPQPRSLQTSAEVRAYLGVTPRRYKPGEVDRTGRIYKRGNQQLRT
ncbi:transposase [Bradyrhizobium sp. IC4061]|nr:transposase [Bradyrhizobium sp. IC4061]